MKPPLRDAVTVNSALPPAVTLMGDFASVASVNGASPRTARASPGPRSFRVIVGLFGTWFGFTFGSGHTTLNGRAEYDLPGAVAFTSMKPAQSAAFPVAVSTSVPVVWLPSVTDRITEPMLRVTPASLMRL